MPGLQALQRVPDFLQLKARDGQVIMVFGDKKLAVNDGQIALSLSPAVPAKTMLIGFASIVLQVLTAAAMSLAEVADQ